MVRNEQLVATIVPSVLKAVTKEAPEYGRIEAEGVSKVSVLSFLKASVLISTSPVVEKIFGAPKYVPLKLAVPVVKSSRVMSPLLEV
jgi:hypothetical protein